MKKFVEILFVLELLFSFASCISTNPYDDYISADPNLQSDDVEIGSAFDLIGPSDFQGYVAITLYEPDKFLFLINQNDKATNQFIYKDRSSVLKHVNNLCRKREDDFHAVTTVDNSIIVIDANKDRSSYKTKNAVEKTAHAVANSLSGLSGKSY